MALRAAQPAVAFKTVRVAQALTALGHVPISTHVDVGNAERFSPRDLSIRSHHERRHRVDHVAVGLAVVVEEGGPVEVHADANRAAVRCLRQAVKPVGIDLAGHRDQRIVGQRLGGNGGGPSARGERSTQCVTQLVHLRAGRPTRFWTIELKLCEVIRLGRALVIALDEHLQHQPRLDQRTELLLLSISVSRCFVK